MLLRQIKHPLRRKIKLVKIARYMIARYADIIVLRTS